MHPSRTIILAAAALLIQPLHADSGRDAWLHYPPQPIPASLPAVLTSLGDAPELRSAAHELIHGIQRLYRRTLRVQPQIPNEDAFLLATFDALKTQAPQLQLTTAPNLPPDSFQIKAIACAGHRCIVVAAPNARGVLYGTFALLRHLALNQPVDDLQKPFTANRWVNEWDNLDGSIERGYAGRSLFFENNAVRADLTRASEYARLLASLGINGCAINNVNANPRLLAPEFLPQLARVAAAFRPWGVRLAISVDFASPRSVGGLDSFDPLDPRVAAWWQNKANEIYRAIPDFGGFVLKADSEGRAGPSAYKRTHADAANVAARALQPHGGLLFYRGFVYDHHMDWRNLKNDRARAAYDNFQPLDGQFEPNAIIQIKHGPIDFQVREPASPLFGALRKTKAAIELQITQEYFGQARHTVFLVPMWKEALDFDLHANGPNTPVKALATGGFIGVSNVGLDDNWTANHLSQANLYGFGRLAWNPNLSARDIVEEWIRLTFNSKPEVTGAISNIQLTSWRNFENYTGPLGLQTLTDITGTHYGPAVEASERNGWGQWHRADEKGAGMDRTSTGTGYLSQYAPDVARFYESLATCPDDLLLFMHHVSYTYRLHSGKSVIQSIYDSHYEGAAAAASYVPQWKPLRGLIDDRRYREVLAQLEYQAGHAQVWRDAITAWFWRESGIPDTRGRVGKYPGRIEAESMKLKNYEITAVTPWETASGGQAITCRSPQCSAAFSFQGAPGWYNLRIQYFDLPDAVSRYRLVLNAQPIDEWAADDHLPARKIDGASSTRRAITGLALRPGDEIRIDATPDKNEAATLDYIEITPVH